MTTPGKAAREAADSAEQAETAAERTDDPSEDAGQEATREDTPPPVHSEHFGEPGAPLHHSPFHIGFFGAAGAVLAIWLGQQVQAIGSVLILIVVSLFLAAGLNPLVEWFMRRGLRRSLSVLAVIVIVVAALGLFVTAIVPVISDQIAALTKNAPEWLDELQRNRRVQRWNEDYQLIDKIKDYIANGGFAEKAFGGVLGFGLAVLGALFNAFVIVVLTMYFLASLPKTKAAIYRLAPASRRDRVTKLGDQIVRNVGGYVSGAFIVAMCAGISSLVFLFAVGLGKYAVALAFVVALLDVIPMIGATIGAVIVTAIGFATDPKIGLACLVFYVIYQQLENYAIYPRVMSKAVDIPGAVTVIAALVGAALLGVVGALLAIPTAAAIMMLTKEVFIRRQDAR